MKLEIYKDKMCIFAETPQDEAYLTQLGLNKAPTVIFEESKYGGKLTIKNSDQKSEKILLTD